MTPFIAKTGLYRSPAGAGSRLWRVCNSAPLADRMVLRMVLATPGEP